MNVRVLKKKIAKVKVILFFSKKIMYQVFIKLYVVLI